MKSASAWFDHYGESHKNGTNKLIHWVCIPVILVNTLGLLQALPFPGQVPGLHFASLFMVLALAFYFRLSWTLGLGMSLVAGAAISLNTAIEAAGLLLAWISGGSFFVAWVLQFVGHKIEGQKPSFFEDLQFLLVGPAWLLQFVYKKVGVPVETWAPRGEAVTQ